MILFSTPKSKQRGFFLNPYRFSVAVVVAGEHKAIFGYGTTGSNVSMTNLVSSTGVVATDTTGVGTARAESAAAGYGTDKAIFGYGYDNSFYTAVTNLVANTGVVAADTAGVGTARYALAAAGYGTDKAVFGYGATTSGNVSISNLVSNTGVVATDTVGVGMARSSLAAAGYGTDKAIFGYGEFFGSRSVTNLVSNTGVVATDTTGVGTARFVLAASGYGTDKAMFGYGYSGGNLSMTNKVSNTGVVASDTAGVGTARRGLAAAGYGADKAIFGYGLNGGNSSLTNLVSNTGVVASDTAGVGTARYQLAATSYGYGVSNDFYGVVLLLHANGTNGSTAFIDSSPIHNAVTALQGANVSTAQSKFGGASARFATATSSYLSIPYSSNFALVGSDHTIECFFKALNYASWSLLFQNGTGYVIRVLGSTMVIGGTQYPGGTYPLVNFPENTWIHFALSVNANVGRVFVNGALAVTINNFSSTVTEQTSGSLYIGSQTNQWGLDGYIDEYRITKGMGRYTVGFTVPTASFPDDGGDGSSTPSFSNVKLLLHMDGANDSTTFTDSSGTPKTGTAVGNAKLTTTGSKFGSACGTFDGTDDAVTYTHDSHFILGTGDFCVEGWINIPSIPAGSRSFFGLYTFPSVAPSLHGYVNSAGRVVVVSNADTLTGTTVLSTNTWYHFAVSRASGTLRLFLGGGSEGSMSNSANFSNTTRIAVGGAVNILGSSNYHNGKLDDFRLVVGEPVYTSAFTPPAAAFANS